MVTRTAEAELVNEVLLFLIAFIRPVINPETHTAVSIGRQKEFML